jgi:hypothetical protein
MNSLSTHVTAIWLVVAWFMATPSASSQILPGEPPFSVTVQLPTFGVAIDTDGLLRVATQQDTTGRLVQARIAAAARMLPGDVQEVSKCRKISLRGLDSALAAQRGRGEKPTDVMLRLAGLTRVEYAFIFPREQDIVLAGPAGGWIEDGFGGAISLSTGRSVVQLEDLLTALRSRRGSAKAWVGCTIQPAHDALRRLQAFQASIPSTIPQHGRQAAAARILDGSLRSLGLAEVVVFGISNRTRMAQRLVAADYRMKRIAVGVDPPPVPRLKTFLGQLTSVQKGNLQRWWFTPQYEGVCVSDDRLSLQLKGRGVQLSTVDYRIGPGGQLSLQSTRASRASRIYAQSFTALYDEISQVEPAFTDLRNAIDLLIIAEYLGQQGAFERVQWEPSELLDDDKFPVAVHPAPTRVACVANAVWKGNRLLSPIGGGVSIEPSRALQSDVIEVVERKQDVDVRAAAVPRTQGKLSWWWD